MLLYNLTRAFDMQSRLYMLAMISVYITFRIPNSVFCKVSTCHDLHNRRICIQSDYRQNGCRKRVVLTAQWLQLVVKTFKMRGCLGMLLRHHTHLSKRSEPRWFLTSACRKILSSRFARPMQVIERAGVWRMDLAIYWDSVGSIAYERYAMRLDLTFSDCPGVYWSYQVIWQH